MTRPTVSVAMITYNQDRFIEQAVRSALDQQFTGEVEILVSDDCSRDGTPAVLRQLEAEFPHRLKLNLRHQNVGMLRNFAETLQACTGDYVAILEGDDYWTSPHKLRQQVQFLEAYPDCAICHHNAWRVVEGESSPHGLCHARPEPARLTIRELMYRNPIVTCTAMYRNRLFTQFPDWFFQLKMGDWPLHILNAQHGAIGYIDEVWGAYRVHATSNWSSRSRLDELGAIVAAMEIIQPELPAEHGRQMLGAMDQYREEMVQQLLSQGATDLAIQEVAQRIRRQHGVKRLQHFYAGLRHETQGQRGRATAQLVRALCHGWGRTPIRSPDILLALLRVNFPGLYRWLRTWWRKGTAGLPPETSGDTPTSPTG